MSLSISNVDPDFICPITQGVMNDAVRDTCDHNFDKRAILLWLEEHSTCPVSHDPISRATLTKNKDLRKRIKT